MWYAMQVFLLDCICKIGNAKLRWFRGFVEHTGFLDHLSSDKCFDLLLSDLVSVVVRLFAHSKWEVNQPGASLTNEDVCSSSYHFYGTDVHRFCICFPDRIRYKGRSTDKFIQHCHGFFNYLCHFGSLLNNEWSKEDWSSPSELWQDPTEPRLHLHGE